MSTRHLITDGLLFFCTVSIFTTPRFMALTRTGGSRDGANGAGCGTGISTRSFQSMESDERPSSSGSRNHSVYTIAPDPPAPPRARKGRGDMKVHKMLPWSDNLC